MNLSNLPSFEEIQKWDDERLKRVHRLIFDENVDPGLGETKEDVDMYLYEIHIEFERRFKK